MRIYYFGELISDTENNLQSAAAPETATTTTAKKPTSEPRLIRDILTERPYAQKSAARTRTPASRPSRTFGPSFLPTSFTIRRYAHA